MPDNLYRQLTPTQAQPTDPPDIGAVCQHPGLGPQDVPGAVCLTDIQIDGNDILRGGDGLDTCTAPAVWTRDRMNCERVAQVCSSPTLSG